MTIFERPHSIYVSGSNGMVGSAICRLLIKNGYGNNPKKLLTTSRNQLDLRNSEKVDEWFKKFTPDIVIIAAAKVGGIMANKKNPVEFLLDNLKPPSYLIPLSSGLYYFYPMVVE